MVTASQPLTRTAIVALNAYQVYLSPYKGFSCPHRLLHGGTSCSEYVKQLLLQQDLLSAIRATPRRFQACQAAARTLIQAQIQSGTQSGIQSGTQFRTQSGNGCIIIPCCIPI
jgi:putative component of membrane protein insertase Oxa1/YidC/SpoIIIJ protein YidD